ncbi:MAG: heparan-alpha-glucosaminide N-acetyltransferase domain-containing protein [Promethearchaeota archaeon]
MSSQDSEKRTDSPSLFNYLKEEIPLEDIRDYASPQRILSIDAVKGFAIIFIIIAHTSGAWLDRDWVYINGMVYAVLDILGPSLFIFLSALSVIFSIKKKQGKLPDKVIRSRIFTRGAVIMGLGVLYNVISLPGVPFPFNLWGWNILMFIGFSQICSYYALKLSDSERILYGIVIICTGPFIREILYMNKDINLLAWLGHFIITSPAPHVTLVPWIGVILISTIFGEKLYEAMEIGTIDEFKYLRNFFILWGAICVAGGILISSFIPNLYKFEFFALRTYDDMVLSEYPHLYLWELMNMQSYYYFQGMPEFLIRGTISNMFYNLGAALLIISIFFHLLDVRRKENQFYDMLKYYGKVSLSLFLIHYIFLALFVGYFNIAFFPFIDLAFIAFMGFFMYIWMEYFNGKGSPEWIMIQMGRVGQKTGEKIKEEAKAVTEKLEKGYQKTKEFSKKTMEFTKKELEKIKLKKKEENKP